MDDQFYVVDMKDVVLEMNRENRDVRKLRKRCEGFQISFLDGETLLLYSKKCKRQRTDEMGSLSMP